ncbi:hypothetical protein [Okeania sp. SIO3I5]|nr:hypothetical protein [Okeania sp. SIO3I5]
MWEVWEVWEVWGGWEEKEIRRNNCESNFSIFGLPKILTFW